MQMQCRYVVAPPKRAAGRLVGRNERLLVLVVVSPHEGVTRFPRCIPHAGALGKAQPIKNGLVSSVGLHPRCAVDALRRPDWLLEDDLIGWD